MIFYFSATGNSLYAAKYLGEKLQEPLTDIAEEMKRNNGHYHYTFQKGEKFGLVFPVYAWNMPEAVEQFLKNCTLQWNEKPYTFAVCTCGETAGETIEYLERCLQKWGSSLDSGFTVIMPDNYVVGFEVEEKEKERKKLAHANMLLGKIADVIEEERSSFFKVKKGLFSKLKSGPVNVGFRYFATQTKRFWVSGECIGCGLCEKICTKGCIHMQDEKPIWDKGRCNMCLACLNRCPKHAIQYGKWTEKRGRYVNPNL